MAESPTFLQTINASSSPEVQMNENSVTLEWASVYGKDPSTTTGLTWGYFGGRWGGFSVASGTLALTGSGSPDTVNYIVVARATGVISISTSITNWNNVADYARVYRITTVGSVVDTVEDHRAGPWGAHGNKSPLSWNTQTDSYTLALTDAENGVAMNKATANSLTIPANATVAFPVGTSVIIEQEGVGQTTVVAAGGVTLRAYTTSSPTVTALAGQYAIARLTKRGTNEWILSGSLA